MIQVVYIAFKLVIDLLVNVERGNVSMYLTLLRMLHVVRLHAILDDRPEVTNQTYSNWENINKTNIIQTKIP